MKTKAHSYGLIISLALAPLALAAPAQRGPVTRGPANSPGNGPGGNSAVAVCDGSGPGSNAACPRDGASCPAPGSGQGTCVTSTADATPLALGAAAQAALVFQIDEERMARELYTAFAEKWGLQPFKMIPRSEARHEAVLRQLGVRAGVTAPSALPGRFDTGEVQLRYEALLALGLESADSALRASAFVEEQDIADLDTLIAATDSADLKGAATALRQASTNHLRAYLATLKARGVTYEPKLLKTEEFTAIVGDVTRGMGPGRGQGNGFGRR